MSVYGCSLEFCLISGEIVLADVIDSDSWRLWPAGDKKLQVDKQFYRDLPADGITSDALTQLKNNFEWVSAKLQVCYCTLFWLIGSFRMISVSLEKFKRVLDSIRPPVCSSASSPSLSESSLARWAAVCGFVSAQPSSVRVRYARPHSPPGRQTGFRQIWQLRG